MAKDNREIVHGIRVLAPAKGKGNAQSKTYTSGMEDELAALYTQEELDAMVARGDLAGSWKSKKRGAAEVEDAPTTGKVSAGKAADKKK